MRDEKKENDLSKELSTINFVKDRKHAVVHLPLNNDLVLEFGDSIKNIGISSEDASQWIVYKVEVKKDNPTAVLVHCRMVDREKQTIIMSSLLFIFRFLEFLSIGYYIRTFLIKRFSRNVAAQFIDVYILGWLFILCLFYIFHNFFAPSALLLIVGYRLIELFQAYGNILVFHRLRHDFRFGPYSIVSHFRTLVIGFISLLEVTALYGLIYFILRANLSGTINSPVDALYYSAVTITTLGYGDIVPIGNLRFVALSEAFFGLLFGIALLGRFVGLLPRVDSLIERS